jgi:hypothetical protein
VADQWVPSPGDVVVVTALARSEGKWPDSTRFKIAELLEVDDYREDPYRARVYGPYRLTGVTRDRRHQTVYGDCRLATAEEEALWRLGGASSDE